MNYPPSHVLQRLPLIAITTFILLWNCSSTKEMDPMHAENALTLHKSLLTLDTHVDTPLRMRGEGIDLNQRYDPELYKSKLDFSRMDEGGLDAAFFAIWTPQGKRNDSAYAAIKNKALDLMRIVEEQVGRYTDRARLATRSTEAGELARKGLHAIYFGMENGYPLGTDLSTLDFFYERGVRYVTLCHTSNNDICDSSTDSTEFGGLSPFGESVVQRMNDIGMIVDVSHASDASVEDVIRVSRAPVIASHSCCKALVDHPRNLSDTLIQKIANAGGVVQVTFFSEYVKHELPNPQRDSVQAALKAKWGDLSKLNAGQMAEYREERRALNRKFPWILPSVSDVVDHIDHIVSLVGVDHVGIGTDFDGGAALSDCYDVTGLPQVTRELLKRGYAPDDIQKIWAGNFLRVFSEVERLALEQS